MTVPSLFTRGESLIYRLHSTGECSTQPNIVYGAAMKRLFMEQGELRNLPQFHSSGNACAARRGSTNCRSIKTSDGAQIHGQGCELGPSGVLKARFSTETSAHVKPQDMTDDWLEILAEKNSSLLFCS